jgi:hypothetical protein
MAQGDMNIANQGFPAFRADLNDQLEALVTNSSGATAPATTFPHQWWLDTSTTPSTLRQRNAANDAWIVVGLLNQSTNTFNLPVAQGGTGAADAGGARTNLGALASTDPSYTGTLTGGTGVINIGSGQLYKDASGNVGINTTSPNTQLEVAGNIHVSGADRSIFNRSDNALTLGTNNTERMRIDSAGSLLVGTSFKPTSDGSQAYISFPRDSGSGIIGSAIIHTAYLLPLDSGTYTITMTSQGIPGVLDIDICGSFNTSNREGYAAYKVFFNRTTDSVTTITVQSPTNTGGGNFTGGFSFSASKPNNNTFVLSIAKSSGAHYLVGIRGTIGQNSSNASRLQTISTNF